MSEDFSVEIKGLDELQRSLEGLPIKIAQKGLRQSLRAGATPIESAMVSGAPKDTGFMAEHFSTKLKIDRGELSGSAFIGPQGKVDYPAYASGAYNLVRNKAGKVVAKLGKIAVATIVRFLEFGTSKMSKRPFMTQAFESQKGTALDAIIRKLKLAVEEAGDESRGGPRLP